MVSSAVPSRSPIRHGIGQNASCCQVRDARSTARTSVALRVLRRREVALLDERSRAFPRVGEGQVCCGEPRDMSLELPVASFAARKAARALQALTRL